MPSVGSKWVLPLVLLGDPPSCTGHSNCPAPTWFPCSNAPPGQIKGCGPVRIPRAQHTPHLNMLFWKEVGEGSSLTLITSLSRLTAFDSATFDTTILPPLHPPSSVANSIHNNKIHFSLMSRPGFYRAGGMRFGETQHSSHRALGASCTQGCTKH